ncbi:YDG domain-containing protein [uncultured Sphaerochaeta sp.]|uniref:YDG domain-containing protein n=1 Tax=uncultured Sphaerochaeta sp. TaxID=886478 RepID=UPI002AA68F79|nr:YDG domain-containing protein [uncultured Sphaerochaeta sp.]
MKQPKTALLLCLFMFIATLLFFSGCSDMLERLGNISLTIVLDTPDVEVSSYSLEAVHTNTTSRFTINNIAPPRHALSELKSGVWTVTVTAFSEEGDQLGVGTQQVDLKEGQIVEKTLLVVFSQPAPETSTLALLAPTRFDSADGQLTGTTTHMEYRPLSSSADEPYTACSEGTTILGSGTYQIRYAAAHGLYPSAPCTVTIPNYQPIQLTVTRPALTVLDRTYNGTTAVSGTVTAGTLVGIQGTDDVRISAQASYDSAGAGANKPITVTYMISGPDAGNYLKPVDDTSYRGTITKKQLTVSDTTITANKMYDGNNTAQINSSGTLAGIVTGDSVTVTASAAYTDKSAATDKTITVRYALSGDDADNYLEPSDDSSYSGTITKKQITISGTTITANKEYDGNNTAQIDSLGTLSDVVTGDSVNVTASAAYADKSVGSGKQITVGYSLSGSDAANYIKPVDNSSFSGEITKKQLTVSTTDLTTSKVYDGSITASISTVAFTGKVLSEDVTVSGSASYDSATAGTGKQITITYFIVGDDNENYLKPGNQTVTGDIQKRLLSVSGTTITTDKEYDGNNTAQINSFGTLSDVVTGDSVTLSATATYADKSAADDKIITIRYNIDGTDAGNYQKPADDSSYRGTITKKQLTVSDTTITANKMYDGNNTAQIDSLGTLSGVVTGDSVTVEASAAYADKNVADNKTITVKYELSGDDADNYLKPADDSSYRGTITKKQLTVSETTVALEKVYDGSRSATINSYGTFAGIISGDSVAIQTTATYDTKDVGTAKPITLTYTLSGTDKDNYFSPSNSVATETGVITRKQLNVSNLALTSNKVYDGTTSVETPTFSLVGKVSSDDVTVTATAAYDTPIAGTGKQISITYSIDGDDKENYLKPADRSTTPSCAILKKELTISTPTFESVTKTYDGTTAVQGTVTPGSLSGVLEGDVVTVEANAQYGSANVSYSYSGGLFNQITVKYTLDGPDASNYAPPVWDRSWGAIERKQLSVIGTLFPASKVYDGTCTVPITSEGTLSGVIAGDSVSLDSVLASYDTEYAGSDKAVAISYTISGTDTSNYYLNNDTSRKASITQAVLTATVGDYTRAYGAAEPAFSVNVTGFVGGESAGTAASYSPPTATAGTTSTSAAGIYTIRITEGSARNYSFDVGDTGTLTIEKPAGPAISGTIDAYFPNSNEDQTIINVTGFSPNQTGIEAHIAYYGVFNLFYSDLVIDSRGRAVLYMPTAATTATKIRFRVKETSSHAPGPETEIALSPRPLAIGDYYAGGIVAYISTISDLAEETDGLIAAKSDLSPTGFPWSSSTTTVVGTSEGYGTGLSNSNKIMASTGASSFSFAAYNARYYSAGGHNEWFLPSKDELIKIRSVFAEIGNFTATGSYWSSTEVGMPPYNGSTAFALEFDSNIGSFATKTWALLVRPVRYF